MRCLVCFQLITIHNLQDIFALNDPCLCSKCKRNLKIGENHCLFEQNEWLLSVLERLDQGDLVLLQLFIPQYVKEIRKQFRSYKSVTILDMSGEGHYPWSDVLLEQLEKFFSKIQIGQIRLVLSTEQDERTIKVY